jgi:hypothetical protein
VTDIFKIGNDELCMSEHTEMVPPFCPLTVSVTFNLHVLSLCGEGDYCPALHIKRSTLKVYRGVINCFSNLKMALL